MDAVKILNVVVKYIRGDINLKNATNVLKEFGFSEKNTVKVLKGTPRKNIIKFKKRN